MMGGCTETSVKFARLPLPPGLALIPSVSLTGMTSGCEPGEELHAVGVCKKQKAHEDEVFTPVRGGGSWRRIHTSNPPVARLGYPCLHALNLPSQVVRPPTICEAWSCPRGQPFAPDHVRWQGLGTVELVVVPSPESLSVGGQTTHRREKRWDAGEGSSCFVQTALRA